jgi:hypothetical protein
MAATREDEMAYKGVGKTIDEAARNAQEQIPGDPDEEITSKVVQWGLRSGSIMGIVEFYAMVERIETP